MSSLENAKKVALGEYVEEMPWEFVTDCIYTPMKGAVVCAHAIKIGEGKYKVPFVARAYNEGGFNFTELCVFCILEQMPR